jgi:hypothetical protein
MKLPKVNGRIVYDTWKDGSDIYKDSKGYYIFQWDSIKEKNYKSYLPKSWKPSPREESMKKTKKVKKTKKNKTKKRN